MRFFNYIKSLLERYLVRGAHFQILAVAALIGLVSVVGGSLLRLGGDATESWGEAVWWAFLRLSDPGYLGDDVGILRRLISTIVTVLGYVLFMGSLVAIMSQWLNATIRRLEAGHTPLVRKDHVLVLGWVARTSIVIRDLLVSQGRARRFLARRGARKLHVVLLAEEVSAELQNELATRTGDVWDPAAVTLRSGTPLRGDHLERVDFLRAAAIVLPAREFGPAGARSADTHTIKTLLSLSNHPIVDDPRDLPLVVAEILDSRKTDVAQSAYAGPIEVLPSDAIVSRLIMQAIQHPGLSSVYEELLVQAGGSELYVREVPELDGQPFEALAPRFARAVCIGVVRGAEEAARTHLNPPAGFEVESGDKLIFIAGSYEDAAPSPGAPTPLERRRVEKRQPKPKATVRVLLLGWSHKIPALISELRTYETSYDVTVASAVSTDQRAAMLRHVADVPNLSIKHIQADYSVPSELERLEPSTFDHVVMMGADWLGSGEESDARTLEGYLLLSRHLEKTSAEPEVVVELLDATNVGLLGERPAAVLVSPVVLSHMVAQVALRRELNVVFRELFTSGGPELIFCVASELGLEGTVTFAEIQAAAHLRGETAIGLRLGGRRGSIRLNPPRDEPVRLEADDEVIVLSTYD